MDVSLPIVEPQEYLYHGTGEKSVAAINHKGLLPMGRLYVYLSGDKKTAIMVGSRHGKAVVYKVSSRDMYRQGYTFYRSVNGVWLTKQVPVELFSRAIINTAYNAT